MNESKIHVGWDEAVEAVIKIAEAAKGIDDPTYVVAVARGGLPLGTMLSHELGTQMGVVWATHYDGQDRQSEVEVENYGLAKVEESDSVLLVDDVVDTGRTLEEITRKWDEQDLLDVSYHTAVWHKKPSSSFEPTISVETTDDWICYPWEEPRGPQNVTL